MIATLIACGATLAGGYVFGLTMRAGSDGQDRKFAFRRGRFVNRVSGEEIPLDEPVIIFRARDRHALDVLRYYRGLATDPHHREAIAQRIYEFGDYARSHPLKEPGITRDIRLAGCGWLGCEEYDAVRCKGCHGAPRELQLAEHMKLEAPPLRDCPYAHPVGTRCPNCAKWPYPKQEGGNVR